MRSRLRLTLCTYLTLTVLAGLPAGARQAVLCLAPNGHVAIEGGENRCADNTSIGQDAVELAGPQILPPCCGECIDIPIGARLLSLTRGRGPALNSPSHLAAPLSSVVVAVESPSGLSQAAPALPADSHCAFQPSRTTILRN